MKTKGRRIATITGVAAIAVLSLAAWGGFPHLRFWCLFEPIGVNAKGYREYRHRQTGIVMVALPGGKFFMGAQETDPNRGEAADDDDFDGFADPKHLEPDLLQELRAFGLDLRQHAAAQRPARSPARPPHAWPGEHKNEDPRAGDDEGPVHEVTLSAFLIAKHEVTQGQWKKLMGTTPSFNKGDELPVENVSWDDVKKFEERSGLALPTEAQWEYACRAGNTTPIAGTGKCDDMGWYLENAQRTTHAIGKKAPNGFGLHDMHGNVEEWCEDVFDKTFYGKPEAPGPDPICASESGLRIIRGGSWGHSASYCHSASREGIHPSYRNGTLGFRAAFYPLP